MHAHAHTHTHAHAPTTDPVLHPHRLALLSHRTKLANRDLVSPAVAATTAFLDRLESEAAAFVPTVLPIPPPPSPPPQQQQVAGAAAGAEGGAAEEGGKGQ